MAQVSKTERLNVTLPRATVELIDRVWPSKKFKSRSSFLDQAARKYAQELQKMRLKKQLKEGYIARAERDRQLVNEWEVTSREIPWD